MGPVRPLLDGLHFAEGPRWHDSKLWFSDIFAHRVMTVDEEGQAEVVVEATPDVLPSGLGFLPDGRLLIANMATPVVLRLDAPGSLVVHADVSHLASGNLNDMIVDSTGRAYVGAMGTVPADVARPVDANGNLILVEPDGTARIVAEGLDAPNGPCITRDGRQYIVAEFPSERLIGFDRAHDGTLSARRVWADLRPGSADGITVDREDAVWTASPRQSMCRRIVEGGAVTDTVHVGEGKLPLACCLGGADGHTLFILSAVGGEDRIRARTNTSVIETVRVGVPAW